ncbi:MAG: enoyl-CoA hydratase/isomerase family protein [Chloroflexi bacterium]|nr:enoyl-CoA hydratase/isomerase family protein [Chloroflexota bacterium]
MNYSTLEFECRDGVGWLTLNRPDRLNALSFEMVQELRRFFGSLEERLEARVVIVRGAGRAFCAGMDLSALTGGTASVDQESNMPKGPITFGHMIERALNDIVIRMRQAPQPLIAAIRGAASGGGFTLAMACDMRLAAESARFKATNIRIGYTGADLGSSYFLPRLIGLSRAAEYMYTGRTMDATTAERIGFVSRSVPDDQLDQVALDLAKEMLNATPLALRMTKELLNINVDAPSLMAATKLEAGDMLLCGMTEDTQEAITAAYFEKRAPVYHDR